MKKNRFASAAFAGFFVAVLWLTPVNGKAAIVAPYQPDADTLHLWHMDASTVPVPDEVSTGGTNLTVLGGGATLGNASYAGFGNALSTLDGGQMGGNTAANIDAYLAPRALVNGTADNVAWSFADPITGAFTFEALVRIDFDPALNLGPTTIGGTGRNTPLQIISGEQEGAATARAWQFRLDPVGFNPNAPNALPVGITAPLEQPALEFIALGSTVSWVIVPLPTEGPNALVSNGWYHVAVTYDGNEGAADNFKMYWTTVDPSLNQAAELISTSLPADLPAVPVDFAIGNIGRNPINGNFLGLIDEVRISKVARPANGMLFGPPEVTILAQPSDVTVAVGQSASFSVGVGGTPPFAYQWRTNGIAIPEATDRSYFLAVAQFSDALNYDVVITNSFNSVTSAPALLTVRTPVNLTWVGTVDWDTNNINWDTDADSIADAAYTEGDHTLFDGQGTSFFYLPARTRPSSVVVNSAIDYTVSTFTGGGLDGNMGLRKAGSGTLVLETINSYTGPTVIEAGVVQFGSLLGAGSIGSGPVTNQGGLVFGSTASSVISYITGTGGVTNNAAGNINFTGTNLLSGPLVLNAGSVTINGEPAQGNHSEITLTASTTPFTSLNVGGGVTFDSGVALSLLGSSASPDARCNLNATSGTNVFNAPITLSGDGSIQFSGVAGSEMDINGAVNGPAYTGILILRGAGSNIINGTIQIGNRIGVTDGAIWRINSTGNSWVRAEAAGGTMRMGADGVLPATSELLVLGGTLDLAGYNQTVAFLSSTNTGSPFALNGAGVIANSSMTADSVFTLNSTSSDNILAGRILDSVAGGTRKVGLTLTGGGTLTLTNISTYTGDTTISAGTLALSNAAAIGNSANIIIAAGATLSAELRADGTVTINANQTLKGNGAFNVTGSLINAGTIELKLNKSSVTLTGDTLNGLNQLTYGGTLELVLSGEALVAGDSFKLFDANAYAGSFTSIVPAVPASGLSWDTSTLATDGNIRIQEGPDTTPTNISAVVGAGGTTLQLEWPASHLGWTLQVQTNAANAGLGTEWFTVSGSAETTQMLMPIDPANGSVFYRLVYP